MPRTTSEELRAFVFGAMFGIVVLVGAFSFASYLVGIRFEPVRVEQPK